MSERLTLNQRLNKLGIRAPNEAIDALIRDATSNRTSPRKLLEKLCAIEQTDREARNLARRTKSATLGTPIALKDFDWNHPRKIDKALFDELYQLDFVRSGHNVLFRGPAGVGKTTLAQHLGHQALAKGFTVRLSTLPAALADLLRQESLPATDRRMKRYTSPDLLILDELGYIPCDSRTADLFFNIISRRHEKRSVVMTTNLPYKQWGTVFPDATCLTALIDRFAQHCSTMDIDADSWRRKSAAKPKRRRRSASRT